MAKWLIALKCPKVNRTFSFSSEESFIMIQDENNSIHSLPPFANQENKLLGEQVIIRCLTKDQKIRDQIRKSDSRY